MTAYRGTKGMFLKTGALEWAAALALLCLVGVAAASWQTVCVCAYGKGEGGRGSQSLPFQTVSLCQTWLRLWHNTAQRGPLFVWVCAWGRAILFQSSLKILLLRGG